MNSKGWIKSVFGLVTVIFFTGTMMAQNNQQQGQGGFGQGQGARGQQGFGQQGQGDPQQAVQQFRRQQNDRIKEDLGSTEEEWVVLGPKIERIQNLNTDANGEISRMARMFGGGRRGGGGIGGLNTRAIQTMMGGSNAMAQKMQDLQDAIENPAMPESEIKTRLAAVRTERERVRAELAKARADLVQLVTQRQEAILFTLGILE